MQKAEGDVLSMPCKKCGSVTLELNFRPGTVFLACRDCGGVTRFMILEEREGWALVVEPLVERDEAY